MPEKTSPGTDWPIPCPHEGDEERCSRCWASHQDATPYCSGETYERIKAQTTVKKLARERAWNPRRKLTWTRKKLERWQKAINALGQAWNASRK